MADMTPMRRKALRKEYSAGYLDGGAGLSWQYRLSDSADEGQRLAYETGWHVAREERLGIPVPEGFNVIDAETYAKGLFCEEIGEALIVIGSGTRFGDDTPGRGSEEIPPRTALAKEMGDVLAAIEYACLAGLVDRTEVERGKVRKIARLLDPTSKDNKGRRLAPPPLGHDGG